MFKIRMPRGRSGLVRAAIGSAGVVAATAFSGSYQHQYQLAIRFGQAHWYAAVQPLSVEGLVFTATLMMALAALIRRTAKQVWPAYLALVLGTGQAALMNVAASHFDWWWLGIEINVWPAVAFFIAYEMVTWMVRNGKPVTVNERQPASAALPTSELPGFDPEVVDATFGQVLPEIKPSLVEVAGVPHVTAQTVVNGTPAVPMIPESDDLPDEEESSEVSPPAGSNGTSRRPHTCNEGKGPKGGVKTPGCPRCDDLLAGATPAGGRRR